MKTKHLNNVLLFFKKVGIAIGKFFVNIYKWLVNFFKKIGIGIANFFVNIYKRFTDGGWRTKLTHFFMGSGHIALKRPTKGIIYLLLQIGYLVFMFVPRGGIYWIKMLGSLGKQAMRVEDYCMLPGMSLATCPPGMIGEKTVFMDNSMLIMLFGVASLLITVLIIVVWVVQSKGVYNAEKKYMAALQKYNENPSVDEEGKVIPFVNPLPTFKDELRSLLNERFHMTTLALPSLTISVFTVLPLVFMILLAFTNYDKYHGPPATLFNWVGLDTFKRLFSNRGSMSFGSALGEIIVWTFIWAIMATFTNYILGLLLAMIINKRSIKAKKMWRTIFVISIAIPQFITLLIMNQLLQKNGPLNSTLVDLGWINQPILFLENPTLARITVIVVNIWVGVPYTMLITSGILMNIPTDLYESARIDGAGPVKQFTKITLPYMLFVTGPYLITQFIGNINNFNVIFFLTGGGPSSGEIGVNYGKTDILITWLYDLTVGGAQQEYAIGSALGIFIFLISATITLLLYSRTSAATQEGDFA